MGPGVEVSRQPPIFFLSYAHSKYQSGSPGRLREPNSHVRQLFDDLSWHISEMVPHDGGSDPGFMDRSMDGGEQWDQELLIATGTCQVFVALVSQPYVTSNWCAMEWDAFSRRTVTRKSPQARESGTAILPVIWVPPTAAIPKAVSAVQLFTPKDLPDPGIAAQYQREGLYGLQQLTSDDAYKAIAWRLAQRIVELLGQFHVEPRIPAGSEELVNVFRDGSGDHG